MNNPSSTTPPILSVTQLTEAIKTRLEKSFPLVWLQGEISNAKLQTSGHFYFSLKDANAQISAVMFRGNMTGMGKPPKDGDQVIVQGELNVYPPSGKYQLIIRSLRQVGLGELLLRLEELKQKIHKRGWFSSEHKKPLPKHPKIIGVVTSPTGAVIQDILHILSRRFPGFHLILNPVKVQGEGAAQEIAQAIAQFNQHNLVDVMIVGRGGGSLEDLWAFNEEIVAEAIFNSRIPIISAVGHETDHCIADYVADVRAPTPSAAAELVIAEQAHQLTHLAQTQRRLLQCVAQLVRQDRHRLNVILKQPILQSPYALLGPSMQRLDDLKHDLEEGMLRFLTQKRLLLDARTRLTQLLKPMTQIAQLRQELQKKQERLQRAWVTQCEARRRHFNAALKQRQCDQIWQRLFLLRKERFAKVCHTLEAIDPKKLLTKGYAILFAEKEHSVITSLNNVHEKLEIRALLADGEFSAVVNKIFPK